MFLVVSTKIIDKSALLQTLQATDLNKNEKYQNFAKLNKFSVILGQMLTKVWVNNLQILNDLFGPFSYLGAYISPKKWKNQENSFLA